MSSGKLHFTALYCTVGFGNDVINLLKKTPSANAIVYIKSSSCSVLTNEHKLWAMLIKGKVTRWVFGAVFRSNPWLPVLLIFL